MAVVGANNKDTYTAICQTGATSCSKSVTVIGVMPIILNATNNGLCTNIPVTLSATVAQNTTPVSLTWTGPGLVNPVVSNTATVSQEGYYMVQTSYSGCAYSTITSVRLNAPPNPPIIAGWYLPGTTILSANSLVAGGTSLTLVAQGCADGQINWYAGTNTLLTGNYGPNGKYMPVTINQPQTYYAQCVSNGMYEFII